jgi:hypothetical protein
LKTNNLFDRTQGNVLDKFPTFSPELHLNRQWNKKVRELGNFDTTEINLGNTNPCFLNMQDKLVV